MALGLNGIPLNQNHLQPSKFLLSFTRLPYMTFFCHTANIPGVRSASPEQPIPFAQGKLPGMKPEFENLEVGFYIDELLWSWTSIKDWIFGYSLPHSFEEYKQLSLQQQLQLRGNQPQYSDAILTSFNNLNNPTLQIQFHDCFPESITSVVFDTRQPALNIPTATAIFKYTTYDVLRLQN